MLQGLGGEFLGAPGILTGGVHQGAREFDQFIGVDEIEHGPFLRGALNIVTGHEDLRSCVVPVQDRHVDSRFRARSAPVTAAACP